MKLVKCYITTLALIGFSCACFGQSKSESSGATQIASQYVQQSAAARAALIKLFADEREYVVGDGTTDSLTIARRRMEFVSENIERIRSVARQQDTVLALRESVRSSAKGKSSPDGVKKAKPSPEERERKRDARLARMLEAAAERVATDEALRTEGTK